MRSGTVDILTAAELLDKSQRHVRRLCIAGKLAGARKTKGKWQIPVTADPKLSGVKQPEDLISAEELLDVPVNKKQKALERLGLIRQFEQFSAAYVRQGGTRSGSMELFATRHGIGKRSLQRWISNYRALGVKGLIDTWGNGKFISDSISIEAWELFKSMYLTQQQLSIKQCWQNICFINTDEKKGWKIPDLKFMYRFVERHIPLPVRVLGREGMAAYEARCAPYIETDPDSIAPGQVFIGDHHQFNCWVRYRNKWIRPWVTAWMDMRSRVIVGWHLSNSPNQTTILLAMKRAIEKHGPPESVKIDNGRDYDSQMWTGMTKARRKALRAGYIDTQMVTGIYAMMNIAVSFSIPYHPQSKPIERFFDTLDRQFTKTFDTYCGKDSGRKPDHINDLLKSEKAIEQAHDLESFGELAGQYFEVYNNSAHTGRGMDGKSPAEVLATRQSKRVLSDGVLDLLLRDWSGELTVSKNGVRFRGLSFGQFDTDLMKYQGKKVRIAYDPEDLRRVYVYDAVTLRLITVAEQTQFIRYGSKVDETAVRDAMRSKSTAARITKQYRDTRLAANMDLTTLSIKAMAEGSKPAEEAASAANIRPVITPMDGQVKHHKQVEILKSVRKAAGAESVTEVVDLEIDFETEQNESEKTIELNLFNDE